MQNLKVRAMAAAMAAITAVTPVLSTCTEVFAETVDDYSGSESVDGTVKIETEAGSSQEDIAETVDTSDNPFLFIKIQSDGGTVIVNEGEKNEQRIRLVKEKDAVSEETVSKINIYDKDDILISNENAEANNYTYVYETASASAVTLKALADDGYQVEKFDISKTVDGIDMPEDSDFKKGVDKYENIVFMTENKKAEIGFAKKETKEIADAAESDDLITVDGKADKTDETEADITKAEEGSVDLSVIEKTEPEGDTENTETEDEAKSDEITMNDKQEPDTGEASEDTPVETVEDTVEETTVEEEKTAETVSEDKETVEDVDSESKEDVVAGDDGNTEEKPVEQVEITGETHFVETADGVKDLDKKDFQTGRLVVLTDAAEDIIDQEHVIGTYGNIYLLQYKSVEQAMNAYIYYQTHASAVEPDVAVEAAETMETAEAVEEKTGGNITASEEEGSTAETVEDVGDNADNTDNKTETMEETPDIAEVVRQGEAGTLPGAAPHRAAKPAIDAAIEHILAHEQIGAPRPHIPEHRLPPLRNVFLYFTRLPQNYQGNRGKFQAVVTPRSRRGSAARTGTRHTPVGAIHESPASLPFHPSLPCAKGGGGVADGGIVTKLRDNPSVT